MYWVVFLKLQTTKKRFAFTTPECGKLQKKLLKSMRGIAFCGTRTIQFYLLRMTQDKSISLTARFSKPQVRLSHSFNFQVLIKVVASALVCIRIT